MVTPGDQRALALEIRRIYDQAELDILEQIARILAQDADSPDWATRRLRQVAILQKAIKQIISDLDAGIPVEVEKALIAAYTYGQTEANHDLNLALKRHAMHMGIEFTIPEAHASISLGNMVAVRAVSALARSTILDLEHMRLPILRSVDDIYRRTVTQTASKVLAGTHTYRQAIQESLNRYADAGVSGYVDKAGKKWSMGAYAEMSVRTATVHAATQGTIDRLTERGHKLVIISNHPRQCPICRPWEGQVLSVSGDDDRYPSLASATAAGLFHPNCRHAASAYIDGYTTMPEVHEDQRGYELSQDQRRIERTLRMWIKRKQVAVTPEAKKQVQQKINQWTSTLKQHVDAHGRL